MTATATTTAPVNVYQLAQELGFPPLRVIGPENGVTIVRSSAVDPATLTAAVAAHVADPSIAPPPEADRIDPVLAAVSTARAEVAGFSPESGTRQAVEALATAVESLAQGAHPVEVPLRIA